MRETGERFVCDRCKKELFKPYDDEYTEDTYPIDWGLHLTDDGVNKHLCPDCYGTYQVMIADFMTLREIKVVE